MTSPSIRNDHNYRKREAERLDAYGVAMYADPVKTPEDEIVERQDIKRLLKYLHVRSTPREEFAVRAFYGIDCEHQTLEQVSVRMGVSRERVRQIIHKVIRKLQHPLILKEFYPEKYAREKAQRTAQHRVQMERERERRATEERQRQIDREQLPLPSRLQDERGRFLPVTSVEEVAARHAAYTARLREYEARPSFAAQVRQARAMEEQLREQYRAQCQTTEDALRARLKARAEAAQAERQEEHIDRDWLHVATQPLRAGA